MKYIAMKIGKLLQQAYLGRQGNGPRHTVLYLNGVHFSTSWLFVSFCFLFNPVSPSPHSVSMFYLKNLTIAVVSTILAATIAHTADVGTCYADDRCRMYARAVPKNGAISVRCLSFRPNGASSVIYSDTQCKKDRTTTHIGACYIISSSSGARPIACVRNEK
ncbi:unnamed protein product [Sympodiomycopsis kandeliae]